MESYVQKLAKKKEPATVTLLPIYEDPEHACGDEEGAEGSCGCGDADGGCGCGA